MPSDPKPEYIDGPEAAERFDKMTRHILAVPKEEVDEAIRKQKPRKNLIAEKNGKRPRT